MQLLVLCYDSAAALYYLYQLPIWDAWKNTLQIKLIYENKDLKQSNADCSSVLLSIMLIMLSKGLALFICIFCQMFASQNITYIQDNYS